MYCTLAQVKRSITWVTTETQLDQIIEELIVDVADHVNAILGVDTLLESTYTEHRDGGSSIVVLYHGPLQSITTVHDDPGHDFDTASLVAAADYLVQEPKETRTVRMKSGAFTTGRASVQIVYRAGFEQTPGFVRRACIERILGHLGRRANPSVSSKSNRDGSVSRFDFEAWDLQFLRSLSPYMTVPISIFHGGSRF